MVKNPSASVGDAGNMSSTPGLGRSSEGGNGNPLQYSGMENPMERGAWWGTVESHNESDTAEYAHGSVPGEEIK